MNYAIRMLPEGEFVGVSKETAGERTYWRATVYLKGEKPLRKLFSCPEQAALWYNKQVIDHKLDKPINVITRTYE